MIISLRSACGRRGWERGRDPKLLPLSSFQGWAVVRQLLPAIGRQGRPGCFSTRPGFQFCEKRRASLWGIGSLICNVILIITISVLIAFLILEKRKTLLCPPSTLVLSCPDGWIGYRGRCYYFADAEADWESSRQNCSAFNASLAVIDSQEEMVFLRRYKTPNDHWIGLQRNEGTDPWRWANGNLFNSTFRIRGQGKCAYMNHEGIASSSCVREEPWICSKPPVRQSDSHCTGF